MSTNDVCINVWPLNSPFKNYAVINEQLLCITTLEQMKQILTILILLMLLSVVKLLQSAALWIQTTSLQL